MSFEQIIEATKSLGVPVIVLGYVLWRGDSFLRHLVDKIGKFDVSLSNIALLLQDLISTIKHGKG